MSLAFLETFSSREEELSPPDDVKYCDTDPEEAVEALLPLLPVLPPLVSPPSRLLKLPVSYTEDPLEPRKELSRLLSPPEPVLPPRRSPRLPLSCEPEELLCELLPEEEVVPEPPDTACCSVLLTSPEFPPNRPVSLPPNSSTTSAMMISRNFPPPPPEARWLPVPFIRWPPPVPLAFCPPPVAFCFTALW